MKKNLLSILILALLIVNIVLTSIMMFSVTGASKKTTELVTDIASVLQLELGTGEAGEEVETIPLSQTEVYNISEKTIALQNDDEGNVRYCLLAVALSMNTKDKGYKKFGSAESMAQYEPLITSEINNIIGSYKMDDLRSPEVQEEAKQEILKAIKGMFESDFIYNVSFSDIKFS